MMCSNTRFPEAVPLRTIKTKGVLQALTKFFSTFGLPKVVQTDQGTNFMSRLFKQVLSQLNIKHEVSSAYHPESQGALERFHQTLKSMLHTFCAQSEKEWDEGLPLLLFAVRETQQESLGFSPAELVFGHTVGPLKLLKEKMMGCESNDVTNILDYVSSFRERLHRVCELARASMASVQAKMKTRFDKKAVARSFNKGDMVLVLLPVPGSALRAKFSGPYVIVRPGSIDPMTAVVQRVKGFAYYSLSFSRHNKNIKMEGFFLYILSRYFIWLHKWKCFNDICASLKYETNDWLFFSALFNTLPAQM